MAHQHDHHHGHAHAHPIDQDSLTRAFLLGIIFNILFVIVEVLAGFWYGSLALLTDAGHNLSDVGSLLLSLLALRLAQKRGTRHFSYGYKKGTVIASLANGLLLMLAVGGIGYEIVQRWGRAPELPGLSIAWVAAIGIVVNAASAWLFHRGKDKDLNVKGAYLHLAADALVSAGVVVSGLLMHFFGWYWIDPFISGIILLVIAWSSWGLLRDSGRLLLDGVPGQIELPAIYKAATSIEGIKSIHHVHVWAMSTTENALTAHLVLENGLSAPQIHRIKDQFRHALEHLDIHHATLETECESDDCKAIDCSGHSN